MLLVGVYTVPEYSTIALPKEEMQITLFWQLDTLLMIIGLLKILGAPVGVRLDICFLIKEIHVEFITLLLLQKFERFLKYMHILLIEMIL